MHYQIFVPVGAGKNFLSWQLMFAGKDIDTLIKRNKKQPYNQTVNEYQFPGTVSGIWPNQEYQYDYFKEQFTNAPEYKTIRDITEPARTYTTETEFARALHSVDCSTQAYRHLTNNFHLLPLLDYTIFFYRFYGRDRWLDDYIDLCLDTCTELHEHFEKDIHAFHHYNIPEQSTGNRKQISIDISACESFISDLYHIKQAEHPAGLNTRFAIRSPTNETHAMVSIDYDKLFTFGAQQPTVQTNTIKRLFTELNVKHNFTDTTVEAFKDYHKKNMLLVKEYDFSKVPGYEDTWEQFRDKAQHPREHKFPSRELLFDRNPAFLSEKFPRRYKLLC